jgi:hypothetical protein
MSTRNPIVVKGDVAEISLLRKDGSVRAVARIDASDVPTISAYRWRHVPAGNGYAYGRAVGSTESVPMHRLVCGCAADLHVDHIDGDGLNNTRANLRAVTRSENLQNRRGAVEGSRSRFRGVDLVSGRYWRVRGTLAGESVVIGYFRTEEEAGAAAAAWRAEHVPTARESHHSPETPVVSHAPLSGLREGR